MIDMENLFELLDKKAQVGRAAEGRRRPPARLPSLHPAPGASAPGAEHLPLARLRALRTPGTLHPSAPPPTPPPPPTQVEEAPDAKPLALSRGDVEYRAVSFAYEPGQSVLSKVSFTAKGGTTVAFVGATGSGKSTLTRLLLRFYDPSGGAVLVDGQDVRGLTLGSLRAAIGVVPQVGPGAGAAEAGAGTPGAGLRPSVPQAAADARSTRR
jgi:ABC-type multidrug transport system fused ATPase/permease subunit